MKIHKPSYNAATKTYTCELSDGFRLTLEKEREEAVSSPQVTDALINSLTQTVIDSTVGWFTKPLTKEWLSTRIFVDVPTTEVPGDFDGKAEFVAVQLVISKEEFRFRCRVSSLVPAEKVVIAFDEPEEVKAEDAIPENSDLEPLGIGPTRRILQKAQVIKQRTRAARALFRAERLTQEYIQLYGAEDTDWEDENDDDERD
jgi:hypothetical protein